MANASARAKASNRQVTPRACGNANAAAPTSYARSLLPSDRAQPLAPGVAESMGQRFRADFSAVRLHQGTQAHTHADALDARAYTIGEDIVLGRNAPPLSSDGGKRTLAHELAHVVQQRRGGPPPALAPDAPHEAAADRAASAAMSGNGTVSVGSGTGVGVARDTDEEAMRKRNKAKGKLKGVDPKIDAAVESEIVEEKTPQADPESIKTKKVKSTKAAKDTRTNFNKVRDTHAKALGVAKGGQVHHGIEVQVMKRYPGAFSQAEINAASNMRGIRPELQGKRQLHNRAIRAAWDRHYNKLDALIKKRKLTKGTPQYRSVVRQYLLDARAEMDHLYGEMYSEAHAAEAAKRSKKSKKSTGTGARTSSKAAATGKAKATAPKSPSKNLSHASVGSVWVQPFVRVGDALVPGRLKLGRQLMNHRCLQVAMSPKSTFSTKDEHV